MVLRGKEEKTLYVTVLSAKGLPAMDKSLFVLSFDPYFLLKCNGVTRRTSTKYRTNEPT